jgi:sulfur carrier protein
MNIYLNGADHQLSESTSIYALLDALGFLQKRVAVEVNGSIVPRSLHVETILRADDKVEVIHAIGGG